MIKRDDVIMIGKFLKPHGTKGEIAASLDVDIDFDQVQYIVADVDGILVPFFIKSWRMKSADTVLLTPEDIDSDSLGTTLTGPVMITRSEQNAIAGVDDDHFLISNLVGFAVRLVSGDTLGTVAGIEDSTANVLLVIKTTDSKTLYVPLVDEFVVDLNPDDKTLTLDVPEALLTLND